MATKPIIYVVNNTATSVLANSNIPLGNTIRRYCACTLNQVGNTITINDKYANYYIVDVNATFTAPVAGDVTLSLQQNGVNVIGATATQTITTATTEVRSLSFTAVIRATCGCIDDVLTLVNSGVAANFSNVAITVEKL